MNKYENLRLTDKDIFPTIEILPEILGNSYDAYETLQDNLGDFEMEQNWQYCDGWSKAWFARGQYFWTSKRGMEKEKTIYWMSVWKDCFKLEIWFLDKHREIIVNSSVSEKTKQTIRDSKIFGEKMRTFPVEFIVTTNEQLADIYTLIKYKKELEAK